MIINNK